MTADRGAAVELRTDRLRLRRPAAADLARMHAILSDPRATAFWATLPHRSLEELEAFLNGMIEGAPPVAEEFVVEHEGCLIGKVGLWRFPEIGFIFDPACWGRGLASEAVRSVLDRAFGVHGLPAVEADVDPRNAASLRLLGRLGFEEVGRAERTVLIGDAWCDSVYLRMDAGALAGGGRAMKARFTEAAPPDREAAEAGRRLFAGPCEFLKGVASMDGLPPADRLEVCFAGRSNVGKSSLINALTGRKALARASNTPGRTQEINFFALGPDRYLVDLPGYGFAEAPKPVVERWQALLRAYLAGRPTLRRVFLLDRRPPRAQGRRRGDHGAARPLGGDLPGGADQGGQAGDRRARRRGRGPGREPRPAPGGLPRDRRHLRRDRPRHRDAAGDRRRDGLAPGQNLVCLGGKGAMKPACRAIDIASSSAPWLVNGPM